jgi:FAD/FMN-containing dehydrogenase
MLIFPWVTPMALAVVILAGRKELTVEASSSNNAEDALPVSVSTCLNTTGASLVYPRESIYANLSVSQNTNYHTHPEIIVIPSSTEEVAATVRCVATEKGRTKVSVRGGGHSYAAYSLSGQVVIDSSQMRSITFDDDRKQVTVKFGQSLGPLALAMGSRKYALPHGTCPNVGISGHSLGGGWGYTSRKWGWLVDRSEWRILLGVENYNISYNLRRALLTHS